MKRYIHFDLESTCWERGREQAPSEIIEIGAVVYPGPAVPLPGRGECQTFVQPVAAPRPSEFCTRLTTITQPQVDAAPRFPEALAGFHAWAAAGGDFVLGSWDNYDLNQLARDCQRHGIDNPFDAIDHVNVKARLASHYNMPRQLGLGQALKQLELTHAGTAHRGIDDALDRPHSRQGAPRCPVGAAPCDSTRLPHRRRGAMGMLPAQCRRYSI